MYSPIWNTLCLMRRGAFCWSTLYTQLICSAMRCSFASGCRVRSTSASISGTMSARRVSSFSFTLLWKEHTQL